MLREVLQNALEQTDGCLGVLIMGTDGISVEKAWRPEGNERNLDIAVAEYTSLLKGVKQTNVLVGLGRLHEITISGESSILIIRFVNDNYFIAMVLLPEGNFGLARFQLKKAEFLLAGELVV